MLRISAMNKDISLPCKDIRKLKIYHDHLARDEENFGNGTSCQGPVWTFTRFGATITMDRQWNCHGGTLHVYNGGGTGYEDLKGIQFLFDMSRLKNTVKVTHTSKGGGSHPPLGPLERGDVIVYLTGANDLAHTQTCTGNGDETYGANNVPLRFPGRPDEDEAWKWAYSKAGDWANELQLDLFKGATPFTIMVFRKP
jgi:hypothetical protein